MEPGGGYADDSGRWQRYPERYPAGGEPRPGAEEYGAEGYAEDGYGQRRHGSAPRFADPARDSGGYAEPVERSTRREDRYDRSGAEPRESWDAPESRDAYPGADPLDVRGYDGGTREPRRESRSAREPRVSAPPRQPAGRPPVEPLVPDDPGVPFDRSAPPDRTGAVDLGLGLPLSRPAPTVYTARRPAVAVLLGLATVVLELLLLSVLANGLLGDHFAPGPVLAAALGMLGAPPAALGFYGLVTGAAATAGTQPGRAWLRPPLAYLPVGLLLLAAAAVAVR